MQFQVKDSKAPVVWKGGPEGLALVCFGGEGIAVSCEQMYLARNASVPPVLQKGVRITALVRIGESASQGAKVALIPLHLRARSYDVFLPLGKDEKSGKMVRELVSDRSGRFTTPQLAPGDYLFLITSQDGRTLRHEVRVPRPEALRSGKKPPEPPTEPLLDIGEIVFPRGVTLEAWVTARDGRPLRSATFAARQGPQMGEPRNFEAVTNAEGKAKLVGLDPAAETRLTCQAKGFASFENRYDVPPPALSCVLDPLSRIDGEVVDLEGGPVAGATISNFEYGRLAATGDDGTFSIPEIDIPQLDLTIAAPGFRVDRRTVEIGPGEEKKLTVELRPGQEIRGLVRDAVTREPVSGAVIVSTEPLGAVSTLSDSEGAFDISTDSEGTLWLEVSSEGYPKTRVSLEPQRIATLAGKDEPLVVDLKEGGRVRVAVWDEEADAPCQGCGVLVGGETIVTDRNGEGLSGLIAEGSHLAILSQVKNWGGEVQVQGGGITKQVDVVAGQITPIRLGEPRSTLEVHFRPRVPEGWTLRAESAMEPGSTERLSNGAFKVRKPKSGPLLLRLGLADGLRDGVTWIDQAIVPEDYTSPVLDLPLPQGGVRGKLIKEGEVPVAGRMLEIFSTSSGTRRAYTYSRGDGSFLIPFLPAGVYAVVVDGQAIRPFSLEEGADMDLGSVELPSAPTRR
ncbi:MAG TPA: carboxypeptidase-like regulatory domain-containing protein [Thermoanaerobaculia bacterium]|nr:carboxypeptidase-like regulatory domain-containing protein [Thermoanaerobaculia bacterium]